ncbi:MAG: hypothetical protein AB7U61_12915, partial [Methylocystis sp.]
MTGVVQFRDCQVGAKVTKGQLCGTIDQRRYHVAVERRRDELSAAQLQLNKYKVELARAKSKLDLARATAQRS